MRSIQTNWKSTSDERVLGAYSTTKNESTIKSQVFVLSPNKKHFTFSTLIFSNLVPYHLFVFQDNGMQSLFMKVFSVCRFRDELRLCQLSMISDSVSVSELVGWRNEAYTRYGREYSRSTTYWRTTPRVQRTFWLLRHSENRQDWSMFIKYTNPFWILNSKLFQCFLQFADQRVARGVNWKRLQFQWRWRAKYCGNCG
jgi:hypothetical protein